MSKITGHLVISLDFELLWGVFDKVAWRSRQTYFLNTREVIPRILDLFGDNKIACTWATVGMLFNENWEEWQANVPEQLPRYNEEKLSAYSFGNGIQSKETEKLCFAPEVIKKIAATPLQEIGTHTYSHYYCLEEGQTITDFHADLSTAQKVAGKAGIELKSLVFPRNQFNQNYLEICEKVGIHNVRTNPSNWYWQNTQKGSFQQKIFRTGDAYMGPQDKTYKLEEIQRFNAGLSGQRASRLLRPHSPNRILNKLMLRRITSEMTYAAREKEVYHLWWHPHNFGNDPEGNLENLRLILEHFRWCEKEYGFKSANMNEINLSVNGILS